MQYIKRRADIPKDAACFGGKGVIPFVVPPKPVAHRVEPNPKGWFDVLSGRSGKVYRVSTEGECECEGFGHRGSCSHLQAVLEFAAGVLKPQE